MSLGNIQGSQPQILEPTGGIDTNQGAVPDRPMGSTKSHLAIPSNTPGSGTWVKNGTSGLLEKTDNNYGNNDKTGFGTSGRSQGQGDAVSQGLENKRIRNPAIRNPYNPSSATQPYGLTALQAIMNADPQNVNGAVTKALQAMTMLTMMDHLSSPGGVNNMVSGGLSSALQQLASQSGVSSVLGLISSAIPYMTNQTQSSITVLNAATTSLLTGALAGALSSASLTTAQNTSNAITNLNSNTNAATATAVVGALASLGGNQLGLTAGSLAYQVAAAVAGQTINNTTIVGDPVTVASSITVGPSITSTTGLSIPSLTGLEPASIASGLTSTIASTLGSAASSTSNPASIANALSSTLSSITSSALSQGLSAILGVGLTGMAAAVGSILPQFAPLIGVVSSFHLPNAALNSGTMTSMLNNSTAFLGLANMAYNVTNIFNNDVNQQTQAAHDAAVAYTAATGNPTNFMVAGTNSTIQTQVISSTA